MGIEPTRSAWKAEVLPLNYIRISAVADNSTYYNGVSAFCQVFFYNLFLFQKEIII